ncbi:helix-turn-helix domain-containing protein [Alicyclobacillus shizuokensis]|uniref:helix-turn-helix domain-containing protein n=1 Tax=Alicyclobacillus shizuokensis TaxID=392014 RepID=UPI000AD420BB|nr:helix-turn-helix domain-containing protein [Alicyclobacillus shizuokensis]
MEHDKLEAIWGHRLLDEGFLAIPNIIVRNYRRLGIEHGEFGFICAVLTYKHDGRDPYPSQETLAEHLQCSTRQIRKWADSLEKKGLLLIGQRRNRQSKQFGNVVYNFRPLIEAALKLVGEKPLPASKEDWDVEYRQPVEPEVPAEPQIPVELQVPTGNTGLQVPPVPELEVLKLGPEVPQNISLEQTKEYNKPDPTLLTEHLCEKLRQQFSSSSYDTWFRNIRVEGISDDILFVETEHELAATYCQQHYVNKFLDILHDLGYEVSHVKFFVRDS